ncbi:MAG: OsmC family protein [Acidobacteriota bacterium]
MEQHNGVQLRWESDLRFSGRVDQAPIVLDGSSGDALSPMQAVMAGLAGCMAIDLVHILEKGRQPLEKLETTLTGERAASPPRRFTAFRLHFKVTGDIADDRVQRAIDLSRETYCSVWHTLRQDIELEITFEVHRLS